MYYIYILRCEDNSLYTGMTTDLHRRFQEHQQKGKKAAQYTRSHGAKEMVACWSCQTRQQASQLEYRIKTLIKPQKENLIQNNQFFTTYLKNKIDVSYYERIELSKE